MTGQGPPPSETSPAPAEGPPQAPPRSVLEFDLEARSPFAVRVRFRLGSGPVALVGPNGAGKTTLLRMILGVVPARGQVLLDGRDLAQRPAEERRIGYVPQESALFPHFTALGNVAFGLPPGPDRGARALALLESLEVAHIAGKMPAQLSGGERQRVSLARALAPGPLALLLDEPLSSLDASVRHKIRDFLGARLRALHLPALVVTHEARDVAALADRIVVLEGGLVAQEGTLEELRAAPATAFVAEFMRTS